MIKKDFLDSLNYIKSKLGKKFLVAMLVLIGAAFLGAAIVLAEPKMAEEFVNEISKMFEGIIDGEGNVSFIKLLRNNVYASAMAIGMGIFPFIYFSLVSMFSNGIILGLILTYTSMQGGPSIIRSLFTGILPHGVFELTAIFLSVAMGMELCRVITNKFRMVNRGGNESILETLNNIAKTFVLVVMPLLVIAALVECYITPMLMDM